MPCSSRMRLAALAVVFAGVLGCGNEADRTSASPSPSTTIPSTMKTAQPAGQGIVDTGQLHSFEVFDDGAIFSLWTMEIPGHEWEERYRLAFQWVLPDGARAVGRLPNAYPEELGPSPAKDSMTVGNRRVARDGTVTKVARPQPENDEVPESLGFYASDVGRDGSWWGLDYPRGSALDVRWSRDHKAWRSFSYSSTEGYCFPHRIATTGRRTALTSVGDAGSSLAALCPQVFVTTVDGGDHWTIRKKSEMPFKSTAGLAVWRDRLFVLSGGRLNQTWVSTNDDWSKFERSPVPFVGDDLPDVYFRAGYFWGFQDGHAHDNQAHLLRVSPTGEQTVIDARTGLTIGETQ